MWGPLLALIGVGVLVIGTLAFWAAVQNWLADFLQRTETRLGSATHTLQSALVIIDKVIVNGQRVIMATAHAIFHTAENVPVSAEEVRTVAPEDLPADVRARLEANEPVSYELSIGAMQVKHVPTYKLVVRRSD